MLGTPFLLLLTSKLMFLFLRFNGKRTRKGRGKRHTRGVQKKEQRIMEKGSRKNFIWKRQRGGFPIIRMYICRNTPDVLSESSTKRSKLLNNPTADARLAIKYMTKQCCGATFIS